jgi:hypothetical protein
MSGDELSGAISFDSLTYWADTFAPGFSSLEYEDALAYPGPEPAISLYVIPPIAGGGLIDDIRNAIISVVWDHIIKPSLNWLLDNLFALWGNVRAWLGYGPAVMLAAFYNWWQSRWRPGMRWYFTPAETPWQMDNPPPLFEIFTSLFSYPVLWLASRVHDVTDMVFGWVQAVADVTRQVIHYGVAVVVGFVQAAHDVTRNVVSWAKDVVIGFVQAAHGVTRNVVSWAKDVVIVFVQAAHDVTRNIVNATAAWIAGVVIQARDYIVHSILPAIAGAAEAVFGPIADVLRELWTFLLQQMEKVGRMIVDGLSDILRGPVDLVVETVNTKLAIPGRLIGGQYRDLRDFLDDITDPLPAVVGGLVGSLIMPLLMAGVISIVIGDLVVPLALPEKQNIARGVGATLLTPDQIQEAWNRDFIPEGTATDQLERHGYGGEGTAALKAMRYRLPPLTDVIRMAVKEVFSAQRGPLTLDADYPGDVLTQAGLALGLEEKWTRNYWAAHWDLPSPTQGYEMLHRGLIGAGELADLLKALDYAPVWRQRLQDISFNPLTRVDIRRMYRAGVLTEPEVNRAYHDIGYNDANAARLTRFTVENYSPADLTTTERNRELTASQIRLAYRRHIITRPDAGDRLVEIGYSSDEAEFQLAIDDSTLALNPTGDADVNVRELTTSIVVRAYREGLWDRERSAGELEVLGYLPVSADLMLDLEDSALARDFTDAQVRTVRQLYVGRDIDAGAALQQLGNLGLGAARRQALVAEWTAEREAGTRRLTVAEIFRARGAGALTTADAFAYLLRLGYNARDADVLFQIRGGG